MNQDKIMLALREFVDAEKARNENHAALKRGEIEKDEWQAQACVLKKASNAAKRALLVTYDESQKEA